MVESRKERERAERGRLIVAAARELAEAEGWDAVTTRKLAEKVEYSQPVLYSHFKNMDAIAATVALEGFEELAGVLRAATSAATTPTEALRALARAYCAFATEHPALYDAMFVRRTDLTFGTGETPAPMRAAFEAFHETVEPFAGAEHEALTELFWSSLHGLTTLARTHRLRPTHHEERLDLLIDLITTGSS
ncbi:TetR/AcrR family transcriptional regulator [Kribbella monticola]|uniref:TetR/AcrR family transcriptional regulator n=1 Tax=Kribbella monticola TaxID=2185285 RepID=UPI000DD44320|nr:TetR-like C-terminal domain-containing protein [Kribbella monticola]